MDDHGNDAIESTLLMTVGTVKAGERPGKEEQEGLAATASGESRARLLAARC